MTRSRIFLLGGTILAITLITASIVYASHPTFQFDIFDTGFALAVDNSRINITGTATFQVKPGNPHATGGGTWTTLAPDGTVTDSGTYEVTGVARFDLAPGEVPGQPTLRAGLAFLNIEYSDGDEGILVLSCRRPGSPSSVPEGISASKGFTDYWNGFRTGTNLVALD